MDRTLAINKNIIDEDNYEYKPFDKLVLGEEVIGIEERCFCGCTMLNHISFNDHLAYIGELGLAFCESLKEVRLPSSFQSLDEKAFYNTPLERLEFASVYFIDSEALSYTHLKELVLPVSLREFSLKQDIKTLKGIYYMGSQEDWESIELYDTDGPSCLLNHVDVYFYDETHSQKGHYWYFDKGKIITEDDVVTPTPGLEYAYDKEGYYTLVDAHNTQNKAIVLDPRTQIIKSNAFSDMMINTVILPKGLLKIESLAFYNCSYLQEIINIKSVITLENEALLDTAIDRTPFLNDSYQEYRNIFGDDDGYYNIHAWDFNDYEVKTGTLKDGILTISGEHIKVLSNTYMYQDFKQVNIIGDDIVISARAFYGSTIKELNIKGSKINVGYQAFALADISAFNEDTKKGYFSTQAFKHVTSLKYLELKGLDNYIALGSECFSYCVNLERLYIEGHSNDVLSDAFDNCINLKALECSAQLDIMFDFNGCFNLQVVAGTSHFDGHVMGDIMGNNTPDYILIPTENYVFDTINKQEWLNHYYYYSPTFKEGRFYYIKDNKAIDWSNNQIILDNIHFKI